MQNPPPVQTAKSSTGLDENVAALLAYVLHWLSGLVFFLIEKESRLVRFHAVQALALGILFFVGGMVLWFVWVVAVIVTNQISGALSTLVSLVLGLLIFVFFAALFAGWVMGMVKAYQGQYFKLPVIGNFAEKFSAR
jgi:uncharacterized membrane protein